MSTQDPFRHHPELRDKIQPAEACFFRDLDLDEIDAHVLANGGDPDWRTPCDIREAGRRAWLDSHAGTDLWVFGYGSLMWDPGLEFAEVRQARCEGFQRSFCLWDEGGRGSKEAPALMLAIDSGGVCEGLAFRIPSQKIEHETFVLFRREMIASSYRPVWLTLDTDQGQIKALGFVANHEHERITPGIPLPEQARMIASASGLLGTNFDYLEGAYERLALLGIKDAYVNELYEATCALRAD